MKAVIKIGKIVMPRFTILIICITLSGPGCKNVKKFEPVRESLRQDFYAYYTNTGYADSISGKYADIVVSHGEKGQFIFSRETSYLPVWKTGAGKWPVKEIIARHGDGDSTKPDKYNLYSYVRLIENSPARIIVHWRYMPDFGNLDFSGVVHELFTFTPDGKLIRKIKQASASQNIDDWNDSLNVITQVLELEQKGIIQKSFIPAVLQSHSNAAIKGSPVKSVMIGSPVAEWKFDEGLNKNFNGTIENISGTECKIDGPKSFWRTGNSGTSLAFDGYFSKVTLPAEKTPNLKNGFTIDSWVALNCYPYDWCAIVDQCKWKEQGFFFGINEKGQPGLMVATKNGWEMISSNTTLPLKKWIHLACSFDAGSGKLSLYINGELKESKNISGGDLNSANADLLIGLNSMKLPASGFPAIVGIEGLIDEIKIYNSALSTDQISQLFKKYLPEEDIINNPDLEPVILPGMVGKGDKFDAGYTKIEYHDLWDNMWRTTDYPDIIVKFDKLPTSVVFWRGTNYGPAFVTENNKWMIDQSVETGYEGYGCCEHMSDKQCRHSHVRLIENTDARVVVHWRYAYISASLQFPNKFPPLNEEWPWYKSWVDEYYTIYPDGVIVRKVNDHSGASVYWQDVQFLAPPGETAEDQVELKALTLANVRFWAGVKSDSLVLDWTNGTPVNTLENANMELINFKSQYKPFLIFPEGTFISPWGDKGKFSHFMTWNHWPTAQIPSDGRDALFTDRVTHSALAAADNAVFHGNRAIYGFTNNGVTSLMPLSLSWNYPPQIRNTKECNSKGYDPDQRAYLLESNYAKLSFELVGSGISPIYNPCFVIKNWNSATKKSIIKIDGKEESSASSIRQGIVFDTDGKPTLVIWLDLKSVKRVNFEIALGQ